MNIRLYTDGGARNNPGPGAIGVVVCDEHDTELICHSDYIGESTNNIAEYCALIAGLQLILSYHPTAVACFLDSELVVQQVRGMYKVKNERIKKLYHEVKKLEQQLPPITYTHLPRSHEKIKRADTLVNKTLDQALEK